MGVMLQAFYWDCPIKESREYKWWMEIKNRIPTLQRAGFTALWLPPASKATSQKSMGYDTYDLYDLGDYDQKGSVPTWFGLKTELIDLIQTAHAYGIQVYADLVFTPPRTETLELLTDNNVYTQFIEYAKWLLQTIGFDGFRYDMVQSYGSWIVDSIQELRVFRDGKAFMPFGVGECWNSIRTIEDWLTEINIFNSNPVSAFDFPLRYRLHELCDCYGFSLRNLMPQPGTLLYDRPAQTVTFVENHDVARWNPIINDKLLAYAFILTHDGYPCVF